MSDNTRTLRKRINELDDALAKMTEAFSAVRERARLVDVEETAAAESARGVIAALEAELAEARNAMPVTHLSGDEAIAAMNEVLHAHIARADRAEARCAEYEEREAACCPEDVGFEEMICTLQRQSNDADELRKAAEAEAAALRAELARATCECECYICERDAAQSEAAALRAQVEAVRDELEEMVAEWSTEENECAPINLAIQDIGAMLNRAALAAPAPAAEHEKRTPQEQIADLYDKLCNGLRENDDGTYTLIWTAREVALAREEAARLADFWGEVERDAADAEADICGHYGKGDA